MVEYVVLDEKPFNVAEGLGFHRMLNRFNLRFNMPSRVINSRDFYQLFLEEKKKEKAWFKISCIHVYLTNDSWTSNHNLGYMCLTTHLIDEEWKL